ncbi:MAG: hypothetical protein K2L90_00225 [Muribaculaceae bacterium]|nr:hypothetical protein [Muribaculaceae bacterium]
MIDKQPTERESLEIITSMINRTKDRYMLGDGNILLIWGYLTVAVTVLVWILLALTHNNAVNWLWFLLWIFGGLATIRITRKRDIRKGMKSYSDKLVSRLWTAAGGSGFAMTALCLGFAFSGIDSWSAMFVFALIVIPLAEIAQGIIIDERSFIFGGFTGLAIGFFTVCCIAGHIVMYANWYLPLFIIAFVCMMVIPGHMLNYKARHQK